MGNSSGNSLRQFVPAVEWPVTICVLFYGDFPDLAVRFLSRLVRHTPLELVNLRIGCNAISAATRKIVERFRNDVLMRSIVIDSPTNIYKNAMMRRLFRDPPIETKWTLWFDDDSYVFRDDWLQSLAIGIESHPQAVMCGKAFYAYPSDKDLDFVRSASWFQGMPFEEGLRGDGETAPLFRFIAGGFSAIRTSAIRALDWPDPRLVQRGEDYILGEALRQNGMEFFQSCSGVAVNRAERRGPLEASLAFRDDLSP